MTNTQIPSYSGVTINITNPTVNASQYPISCPIEPNQPQANNNTFYPNVQQNNPSQAGVTGTAENFTNGQIPNIQVNPNQIIAEGNSNPATGEVPNTASDSIQAAEQLPQAYPASYYINNYNKPNEYTNPPIQPENPTANEGLTDLNNIKAEVQEEDMSSSTEIINELDARLAKEKALEENGKQTKIVTLTDEYIMSLENYLNNQNTEIRLMAAKEILTRLDEDKTRFDDAALNALLNKMLQDPQKLVRIAALSAFSSGLASGNDYTVQLLHNIQQNPNADKEDVVQAANILLKMSASTEIKYTPVQNTPIEQKAE